MLLIDTTNLYRNTRKKFRDLGSRINYQRYLDTVEELFGHQKQNIAYITRRDDTAYRFATSMQTLGFMTKLKDPVVITSDRGEDYTFINFNVEICCDVFNNVNKDEKLILGSSDPHLVALLRTVRHEFKEVIVFAPMVPHEFQKYVGQVHEVTDELLMETVNGVN